MQKRRGSPFTVLNWRPRTPLPPTSFFFGICIFSLYLKKKFLFVCLFVFYSKNGPCQQFSLHKLVTDAPFIAVYPLRSALCQAILIGRDAGQRQKKHHKLIKTEEHCRSWQLTHGKAISYAFCGGVLARCRSMIAVDYMGIFGNFSSVDFFFFLQMSQRKDYRGIVRAILSKFSANK